MSDIYAQHAAAFSRVSAFVILKDGERVATIALKFPADGAGRLYAYVHWLGTVMVARIVALCEEMGATATVRDDATHIWEDGSRPLPDYRNRLQVNIALDALRVAISFDGNPSVRSHCDHFHLPWNVALNSEKRLSSLFGARVGGTVNEFHRQKCGAWADGFDDLLVAVGDALACVLDDQAFLKSGEYPTPSGHTWNAEELTRQGFVAVGEPTPCAIGWGTLSAAGHHHGISSEELTAFRLHDGSWQMFRRPVLNEVAA